MTTRRILRNTVVLTLAATLAACGGGESGTGFDGGTATSIHSGVITGFGSVYVTGIEFMTPATTFTLDGRSGSENQLAVGMVVTVRGSVDANGTTGTATSIVFEDEVEGIVLAGAVAAGSNTGTLNVMGRTVNIDAKTQFSSSVVGVTTIDQIQPGNVVEVSGHSSGSNDIQATRIELKRASHSGEEIEVKGVVSNLGATSFSIGTLTVSYAQASTLSNGWYVKVHSTVGIDNGGVLIASEVEKISESGGKSIEGSEGDSIEYEGVISSALVNGQFAINGVNFTVTGATAYENGSVSGLVLGAHVEVKAKVSSTGAAVAYEVEFKLESDLEAQGVVASVDLSSGTFSMFGKTIVVTATTILKDERDEIRDFGLKNLAATDRVDVDAYAKDATTWVATQLERVDTTVDPSTLSGTLELNGSQYSVGGVPVSFLACSSCTVPAPGSDVDLEGSWDTNIFNVSKID